MALKASEISQLIKERIQNFEAAAEARDVGTVIGVTDGIVRIHGLADARYGEMLEFPQNTFGLALNLEQDSVGAVVLGDYKHISEGDTVKTTGRILEVPVGEALLGRVERGMQCLAHLQAEGVQRLGAVQENVLNPAFTPGDDEFAHATSVSGNTRAVAPILGIPTSSAPVARRRSDHLAGGGVGGTRQRGVAHLDRPVLAGLVQVGIAHE